MVFNLGISRFLNFKNAINAMQEQDWEEAAAQMLDSRWADQVGQRSHRLAKAMIENTLEV
jgi:lysozyme